MSERERAANPATEEAIKYLEGMIFTQDFSPSTLRAVAVNEVAIDALRKKLEREKGCPVCNGKYADEKVSDRYCNCCGKRLEVEL